MQVTLDAVDRKLLLAAGGVFLLLILLALLLAPPGRENEGFPSTWSDAPDGGHAALLLLREAGYRVERWRQPPAALPADARHAIFILADPFRADAGSREALQLWLARGGSILAIGYEAATLLPHGHVVASPNPAGMDWHRVPAVLPGPLTRQAPSIQTPAPLVWAGSRPGQVSVYAGHSGAAVEYCRFGPGRLIWWADATPLTNAGLSQPGNLELLLNSIAIAGSRQQVHIYWDEYLHQPPQDFWSTLAVAPLLGGLAQLLLIFLLVLWTFSRRQGPLWQPLAAGRLATMEFVETMGALYSRTRAAPVALEVALERFRYRLTRRLGLDAQAATETIAQAARTHLDHGASAVIELLQRCDQALMHSLKPGQALALVQQLQDETARIESLRGGTIAQDQDSIPPSAT